MSTIARFNKHVLLLALLCGALLSCARRVSAADVDASDDKIKALIADLGNEDFNKRQSAEKELSRIGAKAQGALETLKESSDAQVKASVKMLLGRIKYQTLPPVNYLDLFPPTSLLVLRATNFAAFADNARKTAIGKLIDSPAFAPFKAKVSEELNKKPEQQKIVTDWVKRFTGQAAAAVMEVNPMQPGGMKVAALAEITDADPYAVYDEIVTQSKITEGGQTGNYNDVSYIQGAQDQGAIALVGKNLIFASNLGTLKLIVDSFSTPGKFSETETYTKVKPGLGENPDMQMVLDIAALVKTLTQLPLPFPVPMDDILTVTHLKNIKVVGLSSSAAGESFEDRFVTVLNGPPDAGTAAWIPPADVSPVGIAASAPQSAIAFAAGYLDGAQMYTSMLESVASMKKLKETAAQFNPGAPQDADLDVKIKDFETKFGVKVADISGAIKGELGMWVVLADGANPPDIGAVFTCADPDKAAFVSDTICKVLNGLKDTPLVTDVDYKNRKVHQLDMKALDMKGPTPYSPVFAVDGARIYLASSMMTLQKELALIDTKAPGLLVQPDFVKALGTFKEDERKGSFAYIDLRTLLTTGATLAAPMIQMQNTDEDVKKALASLPPFAELFKDVPPILSSMVVQGDQSKVIIRAAVPPMPTLLAILIGVSFYNNREMLGDMLGK